MPDQVHSRSKLVRTSRRLGLLAAATGAIGIVIRFYGPAGESIFWPSLAAAFAVLLCGSALATLHGERPAQSRPPSLWLAVAAFLLAAVTLAVYLVYGFPDAVGGRVMLAPATCVVVAVVAVATILLHWTRKLAIAQTLALTALAVCLLALTGYLEGTVALAALGTALPMTIPTALMLALLALGVLFARPDIGPMAIITSATAAGRIARRLLLPLILLPVALSFLVHRVAQMGWYAPGLESAVFTFITMVTIGLLLWWQILTLYRSELRGQHLEQQALQTERQFSTLVQAVTDYAICSLDARGRVSSWNSGAERLSGYAEAEILGHPYAWFFRQQDVDAGVPSRLLDQTRTEGHVTHRGWHVRKDGSAFFAHTSLTAVTDAQGKLMGFAKVTRDSSGQQVAQEEHAKLQSILDAVVDPILMIDHSGVIESFTPAAERVFGYAADEVLGRNVRMLLPRSQWPQHEEDLSRYRRSHEAWEKGPPCEVSARRKDGSVFPAELSVSSMMLGGRQKLTAIVRDITASRTAREALERSETRLFLAMEAGNIGVWEVDIPTGVILARGPVYRSLSVPEDSENFASWFALAHPDDQPRLCQQLDELVQGSRDDVDMEYRVLTKEGGWYWLLSRGKVTSRDENGRALHLHGATVDVHKRRVTEDALRQNQLNLDIALKGAAFHLWHFDVRRQIMEDLDPLLEGLGYRKTPQTHTIGFWASLLHPEDLAYLRSLRLNPLPSELTEKGIEIRLRASDGNWRWMVTRARVVEADSQGEPLLVAGTCLDITDRKRAEQQLLQTAQHDSLTGLPNRALTYAFGEHLLAATPRHHSRCAVLFVDLDRFKPINDTYGHAAGDEVLRQVARRLRQCVRSEDVVGRLGGDEFLVVLAHVSSPEDISHIAAACLEEVARPVLHQDLELQVSPSIGISVYPTDGDSMEALVRNADRAMYHAKENGRNNFQFFKPAMNLRAKSLLRLETRLRHAVEQGLFELHYQPVVNTDTRRVIGVEALLRWPAENIGPDEFIPLAEASGLILPLGDWVLQEACRQQRSWSATDVGPVSVSVNVSPLQFRQKQFHLRTARVIGENAVDPTYVQLEITENALVQDLKQVVDALRHLRETGVSIALDDFGRGYSSLNYLKVLPLDVVKVDKDFVHDLQADRINLAITEAIIALGDRLGLQVIAEGVETEAVMQLLRNRHCRHMQGFYLSEPMPASVFEVWYRETAGMGAARPG